MRNQACRTANAVAIPALLLRIGCAALICQLSACGADTSVQREVRGAEREALAVRYSIVCVIHGDGDYRYHDTSGVEYNADEEALAKATTVARENPGAEVLIFHQKPRRRLLFLFPLRDGDFYCYRNGVLVANESYWRDQGRPQFAPEEELYRRYRASDERKMESLFLYFGHEIPERGGLGYDASLPDYAFTVNDLVGGLRGFTRDAGPFDLIILSTCFGGTPYTIGALAPFARQIIASPENLHLSYFDLQSLERLDRTVGNGDPRALAHRFARQAFDRLTKEVETAVSVAVYDVEAVQSFVRTVHNLYDSTLTMVKTHAPLSRATNERCDCADLPAYVVPAMSNGVEVFYRPARFGRVKNKAGHSGWECWRKREPTAGTAGGAQLLLK